jgi:hypothetical protein
MPAAPPDESEQGPRSFEIQPWPEVEAPEAPSTADDAGAPLAEDETEIGDEAPNNPIEQDQPVIISTVQGVVKMDVVVSPDRVRVGPDGTFGNITYTYIYTNTGASTATGIMIRAIWTNFNKTDTSRIWQYCANVESSYSSCKIDDTFGQVTSVTAGNTRTGNNLEVKAQDLPAGQSRRFDIRLRLRNDIYPRSG